MKLTLNSILALLLLTFVSLSSCGNSQQQVQQIVAMNKK